MKKKAKDGGIKRKRDTKIPGAAKKGGGPMPLMARKRNLAAEIEDLVNPAPRDLDPEDDIFGDSARVVSKLVPETFSEISKGKGHETRLPMRGDATMDSAKYAATAVSRKDMEALLNGAASDDNDEPYNDQHDLSAASSEGGDHLDSDSDLRSDSYAYASGSGSERDNVAENGGSLGSQSDSGDSEDDAGGSDTSEAEEHQGGGMDVDMEQQVEELEQEDRIAVIAQAVDIESELEKAKHTRNQKTLFDSLLDVRIRVQRAVVLANRLPQREAHAHFVKHDPPVCSAFSSACTAALALITDMLDLQAALVAQNPAIPPAAALTRPIVTASQDDGSKALGIDQLWTSIDTASKALVPYRNEVLDKWHTKTQLWAAGAAQTKLKAINQSILSQIDRLMKDREKLIKRTQLKRSSYRVIGKAADDAALHEGEAYDEEIFDDTDFYQDLLKDFLETGSAPGDDKDTAEWSRRAIQLRAQRIKKHRAGVDPKASKGRKLRYDVHAKLLGFMAPMAVQESPIAADLLSSLFGQKSSEHIASPDEPALL